LHAIAIQRDRGRWTSDQGWHRFASLSLLAAPVWFLVATSIAAGRILWLGAAPGAWSVDTIGVPLVLGWTAQVLIGSWTHLVPAIGPGDPVAHAAQRRRLGRAGVARVATWNGGVALLMVGLLADARIVTAVGASAIAVGLVVALGLLVGSIPREPVRKATTAVSRT